MDFGPNQVAVTNKVLVPWVVTYYQELNNVLTTWIVTYGDSWQPAATLFSMTNPTQYVFASPLIRDELFEQEFFTPEPPYSDIRIAEKGKQWVLAQR